MIVVVLLLGAVSGLIGAFAMTGFMLKVSSAYSKRIDMVHALGSFFKGNSEGAQELGKATMEEGVMHLFGHIIFGAIVGVMGALFALFF